MKQHQPTSAAARSHHGSFLVLPLLLLSLSCSDRAREDTLARDTSFAESLSDSSSSSPVQTGQVAVDATPVDLTEAANEKSWQAIPLGKAVAVGSSVAHECDLLSPVTLVDNDGNPNYGGFFIMVRGDSVITFDGTGVGVLFRTTRDVLLLSPPDSVTLQIGRRSEGHVFLRELFRRQPSQITGYLRFTDGQSTKIKFSMRGLVTARAKGKRCERSKGATPLASSNANSFSFQSFIASDLARRHNLKAKEGWPLKDGLFNNSFSVPLEPAVMLEVTTRGDAIRGMGISVLGSTTPDDDQLLLANALLQYAAATLHDSKPRRLSKSFLRLRMEQIDQATPHRSRKLEYRTGSVGGDAILSIRVR